MDGTLINNKGIISKKTKKSIQKAKSLGVRIVLVTGRSYQGIERYLEELNLMNEDEYCIVSSGSIILDTKNTKTFHNESLKKDEVLYLYEKSRDLNLLFNMHDTINGKIHVNILNNFSIYDAKLNNMKLEVTNFDNLNDSIFPTKITFINEDLSIVDDLKNIFHSIDLDEYVDFRKENFNPHLFDNYSFFSDDFIKYYSLGKTTKYSLEISKNTVTKGHAVKKLSSILNIDLNDIICIGDSGNDIDMIKTAGLGIAMENAYEEVKKVANYITLSNNEDGISNALDRFILTKNNLSKIS